MLVKMAEQRKREIAHKVRIGDLIRGKQIFQEPIEPTSGGNGQETLRINPRLIHVDLGDKKMVRVNIIANVVEKYESEGDTRFSTLTVDDGSGQIKTRVFGDDLHLFLNIIQGDTILIIGLLRSYNQEVYILPEIIRKQDPRYLLIRKLEIEKSNPKQSNTSERKELKAFRDEIIDRVKQAEAFEGIDKEIIINSMRDCKPTIITQEIQKLLEEGIIYEPKPGRVMYLG